MKMNAWVWIGLGFGLAGIITGLVTVLMVGGPETIYSAAGIIVIGGVLFFVIYKLLIGPALMNARLQKTGLPGKAKILEVHDTGITINNNPQVKLVLEIKNNFGQVYRATCRTLVSRINPSFFQPGMELSVKIDPNNEQRIVIDENG